MAVEAKRGCGFRKVGGLYLVAPKSGSPCGRLPFELSVCPACGAGVKQSRGWTWINPAELFADTLCERSVSGEGCGFCPLADELLAELDHAGLIWIGEAYYPTPAHFNHESNTLGVSRRIAAIPRGLVLGETWVFLAHPKAASGFDPETGDIVMRPGVFRAFQPTAIEQIVTESQNRDQEFIEKLEKRGITPVVVPDDDPDHQP